MDIDFHNVCTFLPNLMYKEFQTGSLRHCLYTMLSPSTVPRRLKPAAT